VGADSPPLGRLSQRQRGRVISRPTVTYPSEVLSVLTLTDRAADTIRALTSQPGVPADAGLRMSMQGSEEGRLALSLEGRQPDDAVIEDAGARVYVTPRAWSKTGSSMRSSTRKGARLSSSLTAPSVSVGSLCRRGSLPAHQYVTGQAGPGKRRLLMSWAGSCIVPWPGRVAILRLRSRPFFVGQTGSAVAWLGG
jgi:hypothetical protein